MSTRINLIPRLDKPLLVHATGGIGKTVFLQSLSKALSENHETVIFDCFGGGAYRAPKDARHLPKRGLIHIINNLACDGLCDPLLPINENVEELITLSGEAFRARQKYSVSRLAATMRTAAIAHDLRILRRLICKVECGESDVRGAGAVDSARSPSPRTGRVMAKLVIPPYLKTLGWIATAVMFCACIGVIWTFPDYRYPSHSFLGRNETC
jgi:hypothetical protein